MYKSANVFVNNLPLNFQFMEVLKKLPWSDIFIYVNNYSEDVFWYIVLKCNSELVLLSILQFLIDLYFSH